MAYVIIYRPQRPNYYLRDEPGIGVIWTVDRDRAKKIRSYHEERDLLIRLRSEGTPLAVPISCND